MTSKIRVGLIYGGKSGEHEVSLQTAKAVIQAMDLSRYEVTPIYITKTGEWRRGAKLLAPPADAAALALPASKEHESSAALSPIFQSLQTSGMNASLDVRQDEADDRLDVIFPLLHGTFGEDGTIQGLLEMANIPYVGAGVLASSVGMDKVMMKKIFAQADLPQCIYRYFTRAEWERDQTTHLLEIEVAIGYPCFVKPANLGSSVGISKARNREELIEAVTNALRFDRKVIVEEFIQAREIEVAVLGNDHPMASVPGEIISSNEFYDYKAKYIDGKSQMVIPAEIPEEMADRFRELAIRAFQAIDATGLSRVDFFLRKEDDAILLNEINTMPGFTPFSMYPLLWRETGKPYRELLDDLIRLALERHEDKQQIQYTAD